VRRLLSNILVLLLFLAGCSTTSWRRTVSIVNKHRLVVELEQLTYKGEPKDAGFSHPARIDPQGIQRFFTELRYENPGLFSTKKAHVVDKTLIADLALAVSSGLAKANPAQRVRFSINNPHKQLGFIPVSSTTRGVAFVKPAGVLNIAFDLVDDDPDRDTTDDLFYTQWNDPTRRVISTYKLLVPKGTRLHRDARGRKYDMWVSIPFDYFTRPPEAEEEEPAGEKPAKTEEGGGKAKEGGGTPPGKKPKPLTDDERMERLRYLKDLLDRKIITKETYDKERRKIFEEF